MPHPAFVTEVIRGLSMAKPLALASLLLISTALVSPAAFAQSDAQATGGAAETVPQTTPDAAASEAQD